MGGIIVVHLFTPQVVLLMLVTGLALAAGDGAVSHPGSNRAKSPVFWASIVLCGLAAGLIGGLLNVGAYAIGKKVFA